MQKLVCGTRQSGRTTYLAKYIAEKVKEDGGGRVVVTSPTFRGTRNLLQIVKSILGDSCEIKHTPDSSVLTFNGWTIHGLVLGHGDKIRGTRPNLLVIDDYDFCDSGLSDNILFGFASVYTTSAILLVSCLSNGDIHKRWSEYNKNEVEELNGQEATL